MLKKDSFDRPPTIEAAHGVVQDDVQPGLAGCFGNVEQVQGQPSPGNFDDPAMVGGG